VRECLNFGCLDYNTIRVTYVSDNNVASIFMLELSLAGLVSVVSTSRCNLYLLILLLVKAIRSPQISKCNISVRKRLNHLLHCYLSNMQETCDLMSPICYSLLTCSFCVSHFLP